MSRFRVLLLFLLPALAVCSANAQKNEAAFTGGGYFALSSTFSPNSATALQGSFAHRLFKVPLLGFYAELPVTGSFQSSVPFQNVPVLNLLANSYSALFITPGIRVKLAPSFPVSPYVAVGGGYARFNRHFTNGTTSANSTAALDFGGGLDIKIAPFIGLRGELRDFYTGDPGLLSTLGPVATLLPQKQHNVVATAGIVVRF